MSLYWQKLFWPQITPKNFANWKLFVLSVFLWNKRQKQVGMKYYEPGPSPPPITTKNQLLIIAILAKLSNKPLSFWPTLSRRLDIYDNLLLSRFMLCLLLLSGGKGAVHLFSGRTLSHHCRRFCRVINLSNAHKNRWVVLLGFFSKNLLYPLFMAEADTN